MEDLRLWTGHPMIDEIVQGDVIVLARSLCFAECRAGLCHEAGRCLSSWPGNGSPGFTGYLHDARGRLDVKRRFRIKAKPDWKL